MHYKIVKNSLEETITHIKEFVEIWETERTLRLEFCKRNNVNVILHGSMYEIIGMEIREGSDLNVKDLKKSIKHEGIQFYMPKKSTKIGKKLQSELDTIPSINSALGVLEDKLNFESYQPPYFFSLSINNNNPDYYLFSHSDKAEWDHPKGFVEITKKEYNELKNYETKD